MIFFLRVLTIQYHVLLYRARNPPPPPPLSSTVRDNSFLGFYIRCFLWHLSANLYPSTGGFYFLCTCVHGSLSDYTSGRMIIKAGELERARCLLQVPTIVLVIASSYLKGDALSLWWWNLQGSLFEGWGVGSMLGLQARHGNPLPSYVYVSKHSRLGSREHLALNVRGTSRACTWSEEWLGDLHSVTYLPQPMIM